MTSLLERRGRIGYIDLRSVGIYVCAPTGVLGRNQTLDGRIKYTEDCIIDLISLYPDPSTREERSLNPKWNLGTCRFLIPTPHAQLNVFPSGEIHWARRPFNSVYILRDRVGRLPRDTIGVEWDTVYRNRGYIGVSRRLSLLNDFCWLLKWSALAIVLRVSIWLPQT